ncbi:MAG: secretin N-terminal domain-containing protein [Candidatus Zixiibacteriota bacterium]
MWWRDQIISWKLAGAVLTVALMLTPTMAQDQPTDATAPIKNVEFQGSDIRAALTFLADYGNVNVVIAPDVVGKVTIRLREVHWRDAMDIIGRTYDLAIVDDQAGYIRVLKSETYREELTKKAEHDANQMKLVPLETKIVKIANSVAEDMVGTVRNLLTDRGKVVADTRSNSLVLQEVPENLPVVMDYIAKLDSPAKQIKISAQLLEISSEGLQELGVNWMLNGSYVSDGGSQVNQTGEVMADIGSDPIGRYSVQVLSHDWNLDAFVEALVKSGKGKIIAHPEITTVENKQARIQMGQKVPVKQFDESGNVVIKFEEIGTILTVTPHITAENQVLMHLRPERSTFEFDAAGVIINTNNAETNVIVSNGQTAVIGGLTTQDEVETEYGVPILKDVPLVGNLFKFSTKSSESRDLVIFVTPTIAEGDLAMNPAP